MENVYTCGSAIFMQRNGSGGVLNQTAGSFYLEVEPYVQYKLIATSADNSTRRWIVRANGECGTRLLDTGFMGIVPPLATCGGVETAPCCVKNAQTDDVCTGVLGKACPGRYVLLKSSQGSKGKMYPQTLPPIRGTKCFPLISPFTFSLTHCDTVPTMYRHRTAALYLILKPRTPMLHPHSGSTPIFCTSPLSTRVTRLPRAALYS